MSSSAVQQAREDLGLRLREVRRAAGLSARSLGLRMARHPSKISRIEHGRATPSEADVRAWCQICGAADQEADLVASLHAVEGMYVEWQRLAKAGMKRLQESHMPLYERTRLFRIYEPGVIPGVFQTPQYARSRITRILEFDGADDDVDQVVSARMKRQRVAQAGGKRLVTVLEEWALWARIGSTEMMAGQLGHLINVASWPWVSIGIIPREVERTMWQSPGFWIFDEQRVLVETPTAELTITQPREVAIYIRTFAELTSMAVHGLEARALITRAIENLG